MTNYDLNKIAAQFDTYQAISPYGDGHINDTYLAQAKENYILQRINRDVFHHPDQVMHNIVLVTEHIRKKRRAQGSDDPRAVLHVINTLDGKPYYKTKQEDYFRMYSFIERASSYSEKPSPAVFYNAAKGFGRFFSLLSDFDPSLLYETIPAFHHTPARYEARDGGCCAGQMPKSKASARRVGICTRTQGGHSGRYRPARHGRGAPARNA